MDLNSLVGSGTSLDDLTSPVNTADVPNINQSTAQDTAAHAALLTDPATAVDNYKGMLDQFNTNEGSPLSDEIFKAANDRENDLASGVMADHLSDSSVPLDQRVSLADQWRQSYELPNNKQRGPQELVGVNQLEKDSYVTNNAQVDETRWDLASRLAKVNDYHRSIQKMVNADALATDPNTMEMVHSVINALGPQQSNEALNTNITKTALDKAIDGSDNSLARKTVDTLQSFFAMGETKQQIIDKIKAVPLDQRLQMAQTLHDIVIQGNKSMLGSDTLTAMNNIRQYLVDGEYTAGDRIADDIFGVLDAVGFGAMSKEVRGLIQSRSAAATIQGVNPVSAGQTVAVTNTKSANELLKAAADDNTGQIASHIYGGSRTDAISSSVGPEIAQTDGAVRLKPKIDDDTFNPDMEAVAQASDPHGAIQFTKEEKQAQADVLKSDFNSYDKMGLISHPQMNTIIPTDTGFNVRAVYGPADGGFSDPLSAVEDLKLATRKYGLDDGDISVLRLDDKGEYVPVDISAGPQPKGNYVLSVNYDHRMDPAFQDTWSDTSVHGFWNVDGWLPLKQGDVLGQGSVTQNLIPPSSYIDPLLTRSASVTADQTAHTHFMMAKAANEWATSYKGLNKASRSKLDQYILEANDKSLKFDPAALKGRGWTDKEVDAMRIWKKSQDTHYVMENLDMVRQSRRKGYGMLRTADGQDEQLVRPIANSTVGGMQDFANKVYDPELGVIRSIDQAERTKLYADGGTIARSRVPMQVGDDTISFAVVKQHRGSYIRALRDDDQLMRYRDGHFTIYYDRPIFIERLGVKNADGSKFDKVEAVAANISDAKAHIKRLYNAEKPSGVSFEQYLREHVTYRADKKGDDLDDSLWQYKVNTGRTSQRTRGVTLQDVSSKPTDPAFRHIASPGESLLRSISSISKRINIKEWSDTAKARFASQYKDFLPVNPETHVPYYPTRASDLVRPNLAGDRRKYQDALATWRYIDAQESGFTNLADDVTKNFFRTFSEAMGNAEFKGSDSLEKVGRSLETARPGNFLKTAAYKLLLAANPQRQIIVQSLQALPIIAATNPLILPRLPQMLYLTRFIDRGGDASSFSKLMGKAALMSPQEVKEVAAAYEKSGFRSAVDAHSIIRDDMHSYVNSGNTLAQVGAFVGKPLDLMQKVGFNAGENALMKSVWLSEFNNMRKAGKPATAENLAQLGARVRDLTLNMNRAGELAYNTNTLSVIMQFAQAPHKALAQILAGNRSLSGADRAKLGVAYLAIGGTGLGSLYSMVSQLIPDDDRETHDLVEGGLFQDTLNRLLTTIYGEKVNIDFGSGTRVAEIPHLGNLWKSMSTMDLSTMLQSSPSVGLVYGDNARLLNVFKSLYRFYEVPEDDGNWTNLAVTTGSLFSGVSNIFKAYYVIERGKTTNTRGQTVDSDANTPEAIARAFGFSTMDETLSYAANTDLAKASKTMSDDVKYLVAETARRLNREGITTQEADFVIREYQEANRVFKNNPAYLSFVQQEVSKMVARGDGSIVNALVKNIPIMSSSDWKAALAKSPLESDKKAEVLKIYNFMKEWKENGTD